MLNSAVDRADELKRDSLGAVSGTRLARAFQVSGVRELRKCLVDQQLLLG